MRLLIVTHYFAPDSGAAAVRLSRLAKLLKERGHEVTVLTTLPHYPKGEIDKAYRRKFSVTETRDGVRVIRAWLWATKSSSILKRLISQISFMTAAFVRGISLRRFDVILIEAQPMFTGFAGRLLSSIKHAPYVLNVSDLWPDHLLTVSTISESHPIYRLSRAMVDSNYRGAAGIVVMSPAWGRAIEVRIDPANYIRTIYNAVDLNRFRPSLDDLPFRNRYGLGSNKIVSFIGTFATQYDVEGMVEVAVQLAVRTDILFVFIGAGTLSQRVRQLLEKRNVDNVRLIDWINHDEVPGAWASSWLTFWMMRENALFQGTIPAKLYEALACGVPVVAAIAGEGAAMIEASGGGCVISIGDTVGMAKTIERLIDYPEEREAYSQRGRQFAEQHFDPSSVAMQYEEVLNSVVESWRTK